MCERERTDVRLINLTEHAIVLQAPDGAVHTIPSEPNGPRARVTTRVIELGATIHGVPMIAETNGEVSGLPPVTPGVVLLVSRRVLDAAPERSDLAVPADFVRDGSGQITMCRRLAVNPGPSASPQV